VIVVENIMKNMKKTKIEKALRKMEAHEVALFLHCFDLSVSDIK
jgi:hypothetical protein